MPKSGTGKSYTRYSDNVMKPINWLVGFVELLLTAGFLGGSSLWVQVASFIFMVVIMATYFGIYIYWMLRDPNRLQSEGYNLEVMNVLNDNTDAKLSAETKKSTVKVSGRN